MANPSRTVSVILTGNNASLVGALEGGSVAASKAGGVIESKMGGAASKVGLAFNALAAQAGSFGMPFAASIGRVGTTLEQAERKTRSFGSVIGKLGQVEAVAAAIGLVAVGTEAVHLADALETAHAREVTAIHNAGQSYGDYADKIAKTSQQMEKLGFTNAETESSTARLVASTHDTAEALKLVTLTADVARGTNQDLATATQLVAQVEAGRYKGLIALGIATKAQVAGFKSSQDGLDLLARAYKGQASAAADTFAGKMKTLSATASDLGAKLGEAIVPGVEAVASALSTGVTKFEDFNHASDGLLGKFTAIALGAPIAVAAIEKLDLALAGVPIYGGALAGVGPVVAGAAVVAVGGIEAFRTAANFLNKDTSQAAQSTKDLATALDLLAHSEAGASLPAGVTTGLGDHFEKLAHAMKTNETNTTGFLGRFSDGVTKFLGISTAAKDKIVGTKNALIDLYKVDPQAAVLEFGRMSAALEKSGVSSQRVGSDFHDFIALWGTDVPAAAKTTTAAVFDLGSAFADLAGKTGTLAKADATLTIGDKFDAITTAAKKVSKDKADLAGSSQTATDANRAEADALRGLRDANQSVSDSHQRLSDSYVTLQDAQDRVKTSADGLLRAQEALDKYNSPRGAQERALQLDQIQRTVATTPAQEDAKQLGLLQFQDQNQNQQRSLADAVVNAQKGVRDANRGVADAQRGIADAERGIGDATQKVADAQQNVSDAVKKRRAVHDDAAAAIGADERKVSEAVGAVTTEIEKAYAAQLISNTQLGNYLTLLDDVGRVADPGGALSKALDSLIGKMQLSAVLGQAAKDQAAAAVGPAGAVGPAATRATSTPPAPGGTFWSALTGLPVPNVTTFANTYHINAQGTPTQAELDYIARTQAWQLTQSGRR